MRGQNTIIRMRLSGYRPAMVWLQILDGPCPKRYFLDAEHSVMLGGRPEVHIGAEEIPGTLDLRCLTGLTVLLQGTEKNRLRAVFARLRDFAPERVITSSPDFVHDWQPEKVAA